MRRFWSQTPLRPYAKELLIYAVVCLGLYPLMLLGAILYFQRDLPSLEDLERVRPKLTTTIYSADGEVLQEFAEERRQLVPYERMPRELIEAVLAIEDRKFWTHSGFDLRRNVGALWADLKALAPVQGASTISQQLALNLFLKRELTLSRKLREALTAIRIERTYTKKEILEMYLNQVFFGDNAHGIQSAARLYFDKDVRDLTLDECALLAGLLRGANLYSPLRHPERAILRRNLVLRSMVETRAVSAEDAERISRQALDIRPRWGPLGRAPYFVEYVRQQLEEGYGSKALYNEGYSIYTTLDWSVQMQAEKALYRELDKLQKLVYDSQMTASEQALMRGRGQLPDRLRAKIVQGALVALDVRTGRILAMVGGDQRWNDRFDEPDWWNRATQALRPPGSAFKPFIFAAAIDNGWRATDQVLDSNISIPLPDGKVWAPQNYDKTCKGPMSLRDGLALSRNLATVRLLVDPVRPISPELVVKYAKLMGIGTPLRPYYSLALGTSEVRLLDLVSAFTVFPNLGIRIEPFSVLRVEDHLGNVLDESTRGAETEVLRAQTAAVMTDLLRSVMDAGTGRGARWGGFTRPAGGKTGTTDDYADAWFIGFTPQIAAGVWIGREERLSLGDRLSGAAVALPVWTSFMKAAHEALGLPVEDFPLPDGVVRLKVCRETIERGDPRIATAYCPHVVEEIFIKDGSQPSEECALHQRRGPGYTHPTQGRPVERAQEAH